MMADDLSTVVRLLGAVSQGSGVASRYLEHVLPLIAARCELPNLVPGTLNLRLEQHFSIDRPDAMISRAEFAQRSRFNKPDQWIKLKKCLIGDLEAVIIRPEHHDDPAKPYLYFRLEIMAQQNFRETLRLEDGAVVSVVLIR